MAAPEHRVLRLVLDTNVVVAGLLWNGPPRRLLEFAFDGTAVELYCSPALLDELTRTLAYPKFAARIQAHGASVERLAAHYAALASLVIPSSVPRVVAGDMDDDHVIAAAVAARAEWIVTGDKRHLLPIGRHGGIAIVTASEVIERLRSQRGADTDGQ